MIRWTSQGPKSQATSSKMGERTRNSENMLVLTSVGDCGGEWARERGRRRRGRKEEESQVTKQRNKEREWTANRARPLDEFAKSRKKEGKGEGRGKKRKRERETKEREGGTKGKGM